MQKAYSKSCFGIIILLMNHLFFFFFFFFFCFFFPALFTTFGLQKDDMAIFFFVVFQKSEILKHQFLKDGVQTVALFQQGSHLIQNEGNDHNSGMGDVLL